MNLPAALPPPPAPPPTPLERLTSAFLTGLLFLLPVILTAALIGWLLGYIVAAVGPGSFVGRAIVGTGALLFGGLSPVVAFWLGVALVLALITAVGVLVRGRFRRALETRMDRLIDRVPVLRGVYRPIAQLVRMVGSTEGGEFKGMSAVMVSFGGGADVLALLASPHLFAVDGQPRRLVLIPTAPVPVGGALLFVPADKVVMVPGVGAEDLAKFYISMGAWSPDSLKYAVGGAPTAR